MTMVANPDVVYEEVLAPTSDGRRRALRWHPCGGALAACDGLMCVDVEKAGRRRYAVTEVPEVSRDEGRAFWCRQLGSPAAYEVIISHRGAGLDRCDCEARGECVHKLGLRAVLSNGWIKDPFDNPAFDSLPTTTELDAAAVAAGLSEDPFKGA
jgi:hypothetical protein